MNGVMKQEIQTETILTKTKSFAWNPQPDITTYELALCTGAMILAASGHFEKSYDKLPENAKRHFVEV